jgi:hypothetical protein
VVAWVVGGDRGVVDVCGWVECWCEGKWDRVECEKISWRRVRDW